VPEGQSVSRGLDQAENCMRVAVKVGVVYNFRATIVRQTGIKFLEEVKL